MKLSVSFTLGKASVPNNANLKHNNREFIAKNIDGSRTAQNIIYKQDDVEKTYEKLFGEALAAYNQSQKQPCRRIKNYYEHIQNSKREEAFYEAIVQFGDRTTAPCGSPTGDTAKEMLDEYMRAFQQRNPNLHVFNAVLHMDEESPHLHIDFIPYYTKGRSKGLSKGVSMRAALDEMGFTNSSKQSNSVMAWEDAERKEMERILHRHSIQREDKNAHYKHMDVETYKAVQDARRAEQEALAAAPLSPKEQAELRKQILTRKKQTEQFLQQQERAQYKAFYYSSPEKQAFVQDELDKRRIPYRETENGIEAQECFVTSIREIEKKFTAAKKDYRAKLRDDVDQLVMLCSSVEELMAGLYDKGYECKAGKYISARPPGSDRYIRLKSLGAEYTESALLNRIKNRAVFEKQLNDEFKKARQENKPEEILIVLRTVQLYTIAFKAGHLPVRRIHPDKPLTWKNDAEVDAMLALNRRLNEGATLDTLRQEFADAEKEKDAAVKKLDQARINLTGYTDLKEKVLLCFEDVPSARFTKADAERTLAADYPMINRSNYKRIYTLVSNEEQCVAEQEQALHDAELKLKAAADTFTMAEKILSGTHVQDLTMQHECRVASEVLGNGSFNS